MARTSKRKVHISNYVPQRVEDKRSYSVGIYARLSVDSHSKKNESIESQIEIAKNHMKHFPNMKLFDVYSDLGATGTNFERDDFQRLMQDVRQKKVDCVIVKDFSRFGRNYIETGNYMEKIFPFMGVRFISITDGYDSEHSESTNEKQSIHLKNIINELYAKDIGTRVESAKKMKLKSGSFVGGTPAYGYTVVKREQKRILVPDPAVSEVVRMIYQNYATGIGIQGVIKLLYEKNVCRPSDYLKSGNIYCESEDLKQWSGTTLASMLTNPIYIGTLIQRQSKDADPIIVENAHEGIVEKELFYQVGELFDENKKDNSIFKKEENMEPDIFYGILFCGECGKKLKRICSSKKQSYTVILRRYVYGCPNIGKIDSEKCNGHYVPANTIRDIVLAALKKEFALSKYKMKDYTEQNKKIAEQKKQQYETRKNEVVKKIEALDIEASRLYLVYRQKNISKDVFLKTREDIEKQKDGLEADITRLQTEANKLDKKVEEVNSFLRALYKCKQDVELDSRIVKLLIHKINVYADKHLEIQFNFRKDELLMDGKRSEEK